MRRRKALSRGKIHSREKGGGGGGGDTSQLRGDWQSDIPDIHWKLGPLCSLLMEIFEKAILPISTFGRI